MTRSEVGDFSHYDFIDVKSTAVSRDGENRSLINIVHLDTSAGAVLRPSIDARLSLRHVSLRAADTCLSVLLIIEALYIFVHRTPVETITIRYANIDYYI